MNKVQTAMISALWFAFRYSGGKEEGDMSSKKIEIVSCYFKNNLQQDSHGSDEIETARSYKSR